MAEIRRYHAGDAEALAELYRASVHRLGPLAYNPRQVAAWASFPDDSTAFQALLGKGKTFVALIGGAPRAFCQLHPDDHVSFLYTHPDFGRQGLATALYRHIEALAREAGASVLTTDASEISRPLFAREGFIVRRAEQTIRNGIGITRYQMEKPLVGDVRRLWD